MNKNDKNKGSSDSREIAGTDGGLSGAEASEKTEKSGKSEKTGKTEKSGKTGKSGKSVKKGGGEKGTRALFSLRRLSTKVVLAVLIGGLLLLAFFGYFFKNTINDTEIEHMRSRLTSDCSYIEDLIGDGSWSLRDGMLIKGSLPVGDGRAENADNAPFEKFRMRTVGEEWGGAQSFALVKVSDKGIASLADEYGYAPGHYAVCAEGLTDENEDSIVGVLTERQIADALDDVGVWFGEVTFGTKTLFCMFRRLCDDSGEIVGALAVGRALSGVNAHTAGITGRAVAIIIAAIIILCLALSFVISSWTESITKIRRYLSRIADGELPAEALLVESGDETEDVAETVNRMVNVLREKRRIDADIEIANKIQSNMLPGTYAALPDMQELDISAFILPTLEVGGDFYDFFKVGDGRVALVIGDVSGKGVGSALFMAITKTLIKNHAQTGKDPAAVFEAVNATLCDGNDAGLFVSAWLGVFDTASGLLTYASAGHSAPLAMQDGTCFEFLAGKRGLILGGMEDTRYRNNELTLKKGDKLFLYTDGVTGALDPGAALYGEDRLSRYINEAKHRHMASKDVIESVREDVFAFMATDKPADDITMLMMSY